MWEKEEEKEGLIDRLGDMLMKFFERLHKIISGGEEEQDYWSAVPLFSHQPTQHIQLPSAPLRQQEPLKQFKKDVQLCPPCPPCPPSSHQAEVLEAPKEHQQPASGSENHSHQGRPSPAQVICPRCGQPGIERISVRGLRKYLYIYHGRDERNFPILHYVGPVEEKVSGPASSGSSTNTPAG